MRGPYILTLFPPKYRYFTSINVIGNVVQSRVHGSFAFAYFIPYVVDGSATFINCTVVGHLKTVKQSGSSAEVLLAKFAVAAYGNMYFYYVGSSVDYSAGVTGDHNVKYGGMLVSTASSATLYFSDVGVSDYPASVLWFFEVMDSEA